MRTLLLPAVLLLTTAACHRGGAPAAAPPPPPAWTPVAGLAQLYYDNSGGISDSVRVVIRDAPTLQRLWTQAVSKQTAPPPAPAVDFTHDMLLVVGAGRQTPDDRIVVDSAGVRRPPPGVAGEPTLNVFTRLVEGCHRFQADAYPVSIVRVPRFAGPVRFVEQREKPTNCT
jgi:hypothetical protein